jgi:hypothetical protein
MRKVSGDLADGGEYAESFGLSTLSMDNMRKVSGDLADGGEYAESFGLSTLIGAICGNFLSNKIVGLPASPDPGTFCSRSIAKVVSPKPPVLLPIPWCAYLPVFCQDFDPPERLQNRTDQST